MSRRLRLIGVAVVAMALLVVLAGSAHAEAPDYGDPQVIDGLVAHLQAAADPGQAWEALSPAARQAIQEALFVARIETGITSTVQGLADTAKNGALAFAETCDTNVRTREARSRAGLLLWVYHSQTDWCWDGQVITSQPFFNAGGTTHAPGWEFKGNIDKNSQGGVGSRVFRDYAQGKFSLCLGGWCIQHSSPWIKKEQHGNGHKSSSAGG